MDMEDYGVSIDNVEIEVIKDLVDALEALQHASTICNNGYIKDFCENASTHIRKAIRSAGG